MAASVELEHFIGINPIPQGVIFHPNGQNYVFAAGASVVIGDLTDPHNQTFLRRHDEYVTSIALSPSGSRIASGQRGTNSNVYVWDFETRELLYSLEEHDYMIQAIAFSHDERILVTMGSSEDKNLHVWDMSVSPKE